jgi:hypothetical protein
MNIQEFMHPRKPKRFFKTKIDELLSASSSSDAAHKRSRQRLNGFPEPAWALGR